jgi:hypothetical protein
MELDCALATGSGLTNVFGLSFIDLAPCTECVVNASDAAAIKIQYAPLALVKVFFILDLPSDILRFIAIYFSNYKLVDERVG